MIFTVGVVLAGFGALDELPQFLGVVLDVNPVDINLATLDEVGRELIGFEDVTDWSELRTALAARGIGVGAIGHLREIPVKELPNENRQGTPGYSGR